MAGLRFDLGGKLPGLTTFSDDLPDRSPQGDLDGGPSPLARLVQPVRDWFGDLIGSRSDSAPPAPPDPPDTPAPAATPPETDGPGQPLLVEMAHAAGAAYGDRDDPFLEGTSADWQPVAAETLGLTETGADAPWVFRDGIFTAETQAGGRDTGEVAVHVGETVIDGQKTLMVAFRGTDNQGNVLADLADAREPTIKPVYTEALRPATDAILDYVEDPANGVDQVLVTGHSLGGILAQTFMEDADPELGTFRAATFGSSGVNGAEETEDDRILHVEIAQDPLLRLIDRAEAAGEFAPPAAAPFLYDDRVLSGTKLVVDLDAQPAPDDDDPLFAHRMPAYIKSVETFVAANPDAVPDDFLYGDPGAEEDTAAGLTVEDLGLTVEEDGTGVAAFKLSLAAPGAEDTRIDYTVSGASNASDWTYSKATGSVDVPKGETEATLEIEIEGADASTVGEALILSFTGAGDTVEHRFALDAGQPEDDSAAAPDSPVEPEEPPVEEPEPPLEEQPPVQALQDSPPQWSLHKEMQGWLDDLRERVPDPDGPCEARHLDLGHGRLLRLIDMAEDRVEDLEEALEDPLDLV